ncbi:glycosyltransferase family 2 protein, partial [Bradyrhizobium sp. NBAIM08]|uniref:glycosyltransferase n=1 Tax=Bradyrhizobium sp. NBAIM08 TaxID=2793815 RepID=UPI001CD5A559
TRAALAALTLPGFVEVVTVPPGLPRTKPRALNVGLALARGSFPVVYDAEDVPEPGQLRHAVAAFAAADPDVACLQARLVIDNAEDNHLTRFFAVEYAALFDVVNPALPSFDLPMPLGGTSNHLRTEILRRLGGWDPWNVTEDA